MQSNLKKLVKKLTKPQNIYNDCHNNKMTINVFKSRM